MRVNLDKEKIISNLLLIVEILSITFSIVLILTYKEPKNIYYPQIEHYVMNPILTAGYAYILKILTSRKLLMSNEEYG